MLPAAVTGYGQAAADYKHFTEGRIDIALRSGCPISTAVEVLGDLWAKLVLRAHRRGERRLRVRAELLRDGGPEIVAAMSDELRELHLGVPRPGPDAPRAGDQQRAACEAAVRGTTSSEAAER